MATLKEVINIVETMLCKTKYNTISAEKEVAEEQKQHLREWIIAYGQNSNNYWSEKE